MALLSRGGTVRPERTSCASTRPSASKVDTDSVAICGVAAASSRASASSSGIKGGRLEASAMAIHLVLETARGLQQPAANAIDVVQVEHRQRGGGGQVLRRVGGDRDDECVLGIARGPRRLTLLGLAPDLDLA